MSTSWQQDIVNVLKKCKREVNQTATDIIFPLNEKQEEINYTNKMQTKVGIILGHLTITENLIQELIDHTVSPPR